MSTVSKPMYGWNTIRGEKSSGGCSSSKSASIKPRIVAMRAAYTDSNDY